MNESHYDFIPPSPLRRRSKRVIWYVAAIGLAVSAGVAIYLPRVATWAILTGFVAAFTYVYVAWRANWESEK